MGRGMAKAERLRKMEQLYYQQAYTDAAMAERLGVDRSTVFRDRAELETQTPFVEVSDGCYRIDRSRYLSHVRLNMTEALSLYLAARRASQQTRFAHEQTASALEKVALGMQQPMTARLVKAAGQILAQRADIRRATVFETVARAWIEGLQLRLDYHALGSDRPRTHRFDPYLLEPSPWSDSVYLIGRSDVARGVITLKLERIERAVLSGAFTMPEEFDEQLLLKHAWGIWGSADIPQTVRLRFTPGQAARRLKETIWHPLERITDLPDGGCLWESEIAEWREMLPWVRGWGADVEVLDPPELRTTLEREARRLASLYQVSPPQATPTCQLLWAKATRDGSRSHPLLCHLVDVANVTRVLWDEVLTGSMRRDLAESLEVDVEAAGRLLCFWAGAHDLGKASPGFQRKQPAAQEKLAAVGLPFARQFTQEVCYHASITTITLPQLLVELGNAPHQVAVQVARALGGHHGAWPTQMTLNAHKQDQIGAGPWEQVRHELMTNLQTLLAPPTVHRLGVDTARANTLLTLFSGLTSVADWIGSMEEYFPFIEAPVDIERYAQQSLAQAHRALTELNWLDWKPAPEPVPFTQLFPFEPSPLQRSGAELAARLDEPALVIVEAPTGAGKTELALYLADHWGAQLQQRGLYVAMPTTATSNQMHLRVSRYLKTRYPDQEVRPLLVHGQARWQQPAAPNIANLMDEVAGADAAVIDMSWFLPHKRSLLAPFAVGTVDQSFLSVLQTRHFFVRLFALSHKTVIFDEVHAYDTYMSTIFQDLLHWLRAVGSSVILLSATLPAAARRQLIEAYHGTGNLELPAAAYPCMTWTTAHADGAIGLPVDARRSVDLERIGGDPQSIAAALDELLADGGCAAVICNTVTRAQALYRALAAAQIVEPAHLILFHARFPLAWRSAVEGQVIQWFGKDGERPAKAIVVATQVIEQSLDLDFDVMVSDLAPVDLLLQRAGRLHRHARPVRPPRLAAPRLLLAEDLDDAGLPILGSSAYVYEPYVLLRSFLALSGRTQLTVPDETVELIEAVYGHPDSPAESANSAAMAAALHTAWETMRQHEAKAVFAARTRLVRPPEDGQLLKGGSLDLQEENPEVHSTLQALTRLGPPTVTLVCLHTLPDGLNTEPEGSGEWIDLTLLPDATQTRALAGAAVSVQDRDVVQFCRQQGETPPAWRDHPLLRSQYVMCFADGECVMGSTGRRLRLSKTYGLEIIREEQ